ncbi:hypothetical protein [Streptomyces sp. RP5T]|uniref:hypothetical protein n=1 Tax=Streptomyces sp. RP5T TaxID=2490848 RepID=UPI000F645C82|nr:hypothetical protein [Streptomyces sp. RP5T]RRR85800.1 hypothetical protein EHS43_06780 [Streptomyces sp. RP5T]
MNTIVAHTHSFVISVDTHAETHTHAIPAANGEHLGTKAFPNTHAGRARAISWAGRRTGGDLGALWVIEDAGSYEAQIARQRHIPATTWLKPPEWAAPPAAASANPTRSTPGA